MIDDSFKKLYTHSRVMLSNENYIDVQRVEGSIPEIFCTNKQVSSEDCLVSKLSQEEMVLMKEESIEPY